MRREGFDIAFECDGHDIDRTLAEHPCDLILLDLGLPDEDGLVIASRLRQQQPALGIVMLTARANVNDRLAGLEGGADAYLVKPVDMRELAATLRSVHRRLATAAPPAEAWTLAPATLSLFTPAGNTVALTVAEMILLKCLAAAAAPEPVSREALAAAMGQPQPDFDYRRLEVAFSRLRKKIDSASAGESPIRSARSRGYVFAAPIRVNP